MLVMYDEYNILLALANEQFDGLQKAYNRSDWSTPFIAKDFSD
jgi:hypothetical protein